MGKGEVATSFNLPRESNSLIDAASARAPRPGSPLEFSKQPRVEPSIEPEVLIDAVRQRPTKVFCPGRSVMKTTARPSRTQSGFGAPKWHPILSAEAIQGL